MNFNFETLTKEEFEGFLADAKEMQTQLDTVKGQLADTEAALSVVSEERDKLKTASLEAEKKQKLTEQVSAMRSQAEGLLANAQISAYEFTQYFGKELSEDLTKFADEFELALTQRWLERSAKNESDKRINLTSLTFANGSAEYKSSLTAENLAV